MRNSTWAGREKSDFAAHETKGAKKMADLLVIYNTDTGKGHAVLDGKKQLANVSEAHLTRAGCSVLDARGNDVTQGYLRAKGVQEPTPNEKKLQRDVAAFFEGKPEPEKEPEPQSQLARDLAAFLAGRRQ
jgi:hypothetical protein